MGEGKVAGYTPLKNELSTKTGGPAKRKKEAKKKNVLEYGKLKEFSTFQHGKQTTSYLTFIFKKRTCIVFTGLSHKTV
jgi:hypothetical protein